MKRFVRSLPLYGLVTPTFLLLGVFSLIPFLWAFWTSFFEYEVGGDSRWIGIANYTEYLQDPTTVPTFLHMGALTLFGALVTLVCPLAVARMIFGLSSERARYLYRVLFLIPIVVPGIAGTLLWKGLVYGDRGLLNETLRLVGLGGYANGWLSDPNLALWSVAFIGFPFAGGINILIYYAGLSSIPDTVQDAAQLDGASGLRKFFRIEFPLLLSQVKLLMILVVIGGVQAFEGMLALTKGGPGFQTMLPGLWMYYNAFSFQRMGYACAIGVVLFLLILVLTIINLKYIRSAEEIQEARVVKRRKRINDLVLHGILIAILALTLLPFVFVINNSLRTNAQMDHSFFGLPTGTWSQLTQSYRDAWEVLRPYTLNTLFVAAVTAFGVVTLGSITAYVFSRYRFPVTERCFSFFLVL